MANVSDIKTHKSLTAAAATSRPPLSERELERIAGSGIVMTRYFFNIRLADGVLKDTEGQELRSLEEARAEAIETAKELMAESILLGEKIDHRAFEISDESGETLDVIPFSVAVDRPAS
jgi:hypothetical protein